MTDSNTLNLSIYDDFYGRALSQKCYLQYDDKDVF